MDEIHCAEAAAEPGSAAQPDTGLDLFVYGTLKRGFGNNDLLVFGGARFVAEDALPGFATDARFPAAVRAHGSALRGEVWTDVSPALWDALDAFESMYVRTRARTAAGRDVAVYVTRHPAMVWTRAESWPCWSRVSV